MAEANKSKEEFQQSKKKLFQELEKVKKLKNSDDIFKAMNQIIKNTQEMGLSDFQRFALYFYSHYNHLFQKSNYYDKFAELAKFMIRNLFQENFRDSVRGQMKTIFHDWNLFEDGKNVIEDEKNLFEDGKNLFEDKKKSSDMDDYEMCFFLCTLTKNINLMEIFFIEYLNIEIFKHEEFIVLDLENPYALELFKRIFDKIYLKNKKNFQKIGKDTQILLLESIIETNHSNYNLFRCEKCFSIKHIKKNKKKNFFLKCMKCDDNYSSFDIDCLITKISEMDFFCSICEKQLFLYETNFKCISCKKLICMNCKVEHLKNCFSLNFIKLHEVGYKCEIHCKNYIEYCFTCKQNLCKSCKIIHCHRTYEPTNIDNYLKNINYDENDLITSTLITIYKENNRNFNFNGYIYEILCSLQNINMSNKILFSQFNDSSFQNYYEIAFKKISEGSFYYLNRLIEIKKIYKEKKINELSYNPNIVNERESKIKDFIDKTKFYLFKFSAIHQFIDFGNMFNKLKKENSDLLIIIEELKSELLYVKNANKKNEENTHNILARFLANELLNKIIYLFHDELDENALNLNIFLELISSKKYEVLSNMDIINSISNISDDLNNLVKNLKENPDDLSIRKNLINYIKSSDFAQIKFVKDITIGEEVFKKEDLNILLDVLFFIKSYGNKTAHPNIDPNKPLININTKKSPVKFMIDEFYETELKELMEKEIKNTNVIDQNDGKELTTSVSNEIANIEYTNNLLKGYDYDEDEDEGNYYNSNDYEFKKIKIINNYALIDNINAYKILAHKAIVLKLKEIRNELLSRYNLCKMKKEVKIEDIIDTIFNDKDEKIFEETTDFVRVFIHDTDNLINENLNIDINDKSFVDDENIHSLLGCFKSVKILLNNFDKLMIQKHINLDEYINQKMLNRNNEDLIGLISDLEGTEFYESKVGCRRNELVAEICFLLLNKIFIREMDLLNSVKINYEKEIMKNILFKEISIKLKKLNESFNDEIIINSSSYDLTNSIQGFLSSFSNSNHMAIKNIKDILNKIIKENINLTTNDNFE